VNSFPLSCSHALDSNSTDLAMSFIDWAPHPPDANMGIWRDVEVHSRIFSYFIFSIWSHFVGRCDAKTSAAAVSISDDSVEQ
jgi:hypothetical protein